MKFNDSNIIVGFIKELLHSFNLPTIPVYIADTTNLYEDRVYIKDNFVCKYKNNKFNKLTSFVYNTPILNLTKNLIINSSMYDSYTHKYLGDYLRFLRDYKKLNLMGMYNCFSNEQLERVEYSTSFETQSTNIFSETLDTETSKTTFSIRTNINDYIYYAIPVKFNENYTIALNCDFKFEMACILYNNEFITLTPESLIHESYKAVDGTNFTSPIIFNTNFECAKDLWRNEKDLKLILKIPSGIKTSIVVLEGNFLPCANVVDGNFISNIIEDETNLPDIYYSKNSLLYVDDKEIHPIADRLIEYLIGNAITNIDFIDKNIKRVQDYIYKDSAQFKGVYGIWDYELQYNIYNQFLKLDKTKGMRRFSNTISLIDNIVDAKSIGADEANYTLYLASKPIGSVIEPGSQIVLSEETINESVIKDYIYIYYYKYKRDEEGQIIGKEPFYLDFKNKINYISYSSNDLYKVELTNNTISQLENSGQIPNIGPVESDGKIISDGQIMIKKQNKNKEAKRFIDLYYDLYGYVDKDTESLLRLL